MNIFFYDFTLKYTGDTLNNQPLGGSQTALINTAAELAKLGNNIFVFTVCDAPEICANVAYIPNNRIAEWFGKVACDAFISLRGTQIFDNNLPAKLKILWAHDSAVQDNGATLDRLKNPEFVKNNIDRIFTVSLWQTMEYMNYFKIPKEKFFITRNGINPVLFSNLDKYSKEKRFIYTSAPFRGLDLLVFKIWPRLKKIFPEYRLSIFSGVKTYQISDTLEKQKFDDIYSAIEADKSIDFYGNIAQPELFKQMARHLLYLYPNTFPETSCISVMESMFCGTPVITSFNAALPETTLLNAELIKGDPDSDEYINEFIARTADLVNNREKYRNLQQAGIDKIAKWNFWTEIAKEWDLTLKYWLGYSNKILEQYPVIRAFEYQLKSKQHLADKILSKIPDSELQETRIRFPIYALLNVEKK